MRFRDSRIAYRIKNLARRFVEKSAHAMEEFAPATAKEGVAPASTTEEVARASATEEVAPAITTEEATPANTEQHLAELIGLVDRQSRPNINPLAQEIRDVRNLTLTVKFFGYELARSLASALPQRTGLHLCPANLCCKPATQADLESDWAAYWCQELKTPVVFHRKLWELAYVPQALHERGVLEAGNRGLGFGCGAEPIASLLAARGIHTVATDLPPENSEAGTWHKHGQHAFGLERVFHPHLVQRDTFSSYVTHRFVDMNAIPADLQGFDFCWSICALEHLGSIERGMTFVTEAMKTLRPGGVAVHTTEFNFLDDERTVDNWPTVLFQRRHLASLADRLSADGHHVAPLDFDVGNKPLDRFIDMPPYSHEWSPCVREWGGKSTHLKLSIDGFAATCFGLIVVKCPG